MTPRHKPSCTLTHFARCANTLVSELAEEVDGYKDRVCGATLHGIGRVLALLDLAGDELARLAEIERRAHPEQRCGEPESSETPAERGN